MPDTTHAPGVGKREWPQLAQVALTWVASSRTKIHAKHHVLSWRKAGLWETGRVGLAPIILLAARSGTGANFEQAMYVTSLVFNSCPVVQSNVHRSGSWL